MTKETCVRDKEKHKRMTMGCCVVVVSDWGGRGEEENENYIYV